MRRLFLIAAWALVGFVAYATLVPLPVRPHVTDNPNYERFFAYAAVAALLTLAYPHRIIRVALFTAALAVGLEVLQRFAIDRHPGLLDMAVKTSGAVAGVVVARSAWWLLKGRGG